MQLCVALLDDDDDDDEARGQTEASRWIATLNDTPAQVNHTCDLGHQDPRTRAWISDQE